MSHSIITLKLILATVGIIDRLNVCHSAPVRRWTGAPGWCMLASVSSAIRAATFTTPSNQLWLGGLHTFSGFPVSCTALHILLHWHSLFGWDRELYGRMILGGKRGFKTVIRPTAHSLNGVITAKQWAAGARRLSRPIRVLARREACARKARTSAQAKTNPPVLLRGFLKVQPRCHSKELLLRPHRSDHDAVFSHSLRFYKVLWCCSRGSQRFF